MWNAAPPRRPYVHVSYYDDETAKLDSSQFTSTKLYTRHDTCYVCGSGFYSRVGGKKKQNKKTHKYQFQTITLAWYKRNVSVWNEYFVRAIIVWCQVEADVQRPLENG